MNWQEAKEVIEENRPRKCRLVDGILKGGFIDDESQKGKAYSMAIEALESMREYERLKERDRAMIVKEIYQDEYYCPACGTEIFYIGEKETHKFCLECGQRLDWSGEEKEITE